MSVTVQQIAMRMLRYIGVTQLTPQTPGSELESLGPGDLEDVAMAITAAVQEIAAQGPSEVREAPGYAVLHAPTSISLNVTTGSATVSAVSGWSTWMQGCTVRISGDDQDNELLSSTRLARAYLGATGSVTATVYGDAVTLDETVGKVIAPLWLPNQLPLFPATNRMDFMRLGGYPLVTDSSGLAAPLPFYLYYRKPVSRPWVWFIDAAYDASLGYTQRRIRFSPMPAQAYSIAYTAAINPPRFTKDDIVSPLEQLIVSGATSDTNANGNFQYICDVAGYRAFSNLNDYVIFFHPGYGTYILADNLNPIFSLSAYWSSDSVTSPLGPYSPVVATGDVTVSTSDSGAGAGDPGTIIPVPNGWVETILMPIALKRFTGTALFKNSAALPEIDRQYKLALRILADSKGEESLTKARYV
jgi:hypothetical protein